MSAAPPPDPLRGSAAIDRAGRDLAGPVRAAIDVYATALDVVVSWLDVGAEPDPWDLDVHAVAVDALRVALERAGVLERDDRLDPAAVSRLSPPIRPDPPGVIGSAPDGG